jgi:steroid 5-alpha reductase family enzyme
MSLTLAALILYAWILTAVLMLAAWLIQRAQGNAAIVDVIWCLSFAIVAIGYAVVTNGDPARRMVVAAMGGLWGVRLAGHLLFNRILGRSEDPRYASLRAKWGDRAQLYFFLLFQFEAVGLPLFALVLLVLMQNTNPTFSLWEWAGVVVWVIAIAGEWLADWQLGRFRGNPQNRGKTCREGLWRYSRHPNYFFEALHWWAYVLMAIGVAYGWVTLIGPVVMTCSLLLITGIPLTEAQALAARGEEYRAYQRTTSAFIPWFPKGQNR